MPRKPRVDPTESAPTYSSIDGFDNLFKETKNPIFAVLALRQVVYSASVPDATREWIIGGIRKWLSKKGKITLDAALKLTPKGGGPRYFHRYDLLTHHDRIDFLTINIFRSYFNLPVATAAEMCARRRKATPAAKKLSGATINDRYVRKLSAWQIFRLADGKSYVDEFSSEDDRNGWINSMLSTIPQDDLWTPKMHAFYSKKHGRQSRPGR